MPIDTATLPPGHYIIADSDYFKDYEPYTYFWTGGDGGFYDNFDNCYYVGSALLSVFQVENKSKISLKEHTTSISKRHGKYTLISVVF